MVYLCPSCHGEFELWSECGCSVSEHRNMAGIRSLTLAIPSEGSPLLAHQRFHDVRLVDQEVT